jgi:hypothetical protein
MRGQIVDRWRDAVCRTVGAMTLAMVCRNMPMLAYSAPQKV